MTTQKLPFFTLLLMISFASVNAVLFTPALPNIAEYFAITSGVAQQTITWFLIGYALGQLLYGPIANRFGRKPALYTGITIQIVSSLVCAFAGSLHCYFILVLGRFFLALGSGVGLKMAFTLVSECYEPKVASQKLAYLMIAFAVTPALGVMIGSFLISYFNWTSTFYACTLYGLLLLVLVYRLPETKTKLDLHALHFEHLINAYLVQFKNKKLIIGGFIMGGSTAFVYLFAALAPFVAMSILHMDATNYGMANLIPSIGLVLGSVVSAQLAKKYQQSFIIKIGIFISFIGGCLMLAFALLKMSALITLFFPMMICYFGLAFVFANASTLALSQTEDKAHGSAVLNFINMSVTTILVLLVGIIAVKTLLLPIIFLLIASGMMLLMR